MSILIADETLQAKLALPEGYGSVKVCTPDGHVIGFFIPIGPTGRPPGPAISEEELHRREANLSGKWYTTAEVEQKLKEWQCSK